MAKIDDIMLKTGFSRTTVSKALNDKEDISEPTKKIIREAAKELNYIPNINAKNLRKKTNNIVALIISSPSEESEKTNTLYPLLMGVNKHLTKNNLELALYIIDSEEQTTKSYVEFCRERNVLGAILVGIKTDDYYMDQLKNSEIPYVLIDVNINGTQHLNVVKINDVKAAYEATQYLINNHHEHIAFINGVKNSTVAKDRLIGYKQAMKDYGMKIDDALIKTADFSENKAYTITRKLISNRPYITAIFAASDLMAFGAMRAIENMGKKVPEDISVVGFDDIPLSSYIKPALTTVSQSFFDKGKAAAELISSLIIKSSDQRIITLEHKIIERDSVKKLRA